MVTFENVRAADPLAARDYVRVTWERDRAATLKTIASLGLLTYDAVSAARTIQEVAPGHGFMVASPIAAAPGDETIVLDVRLTSTWYGTAARFATEASELTPSYNVVRVKKVLAQGPGGETSAAAIADRTEVQATAEQVADERDLGSTIEKYVKQLVLYAAIAGVAVLVVSNLPAILAAGKAVQRTARRARR